MNAFKNLSLRLAALTLGIVASQAALAHPVPCPVCGLQVVQSTKDQDNEVVLRYGKKRIEYRCVYCAIADSRKYDGDLFVYAPSETKGQPVILQRAGGKWSVVKDQDGKLVTEEGVVFLNGFKKHSECAMGSRAFHSKAAFDKYVAKNKMADAKALTIGEMVEAGLKS